MKRYILGASPTKQSAMICPFDENGVVGDWQEFNAGIVFLTADVEQLARECRPYLESFASLTKHPTAGTDALKLAARLRAIIGPGDNAGNGTGSDECPAHMSGCHVRDGSGVCPHCKAQV
jgi:hypothetical protein